MSGVRADAASRQRVFSQSLIVGAASLAVAVGLALRLLIPGDWDPSVFAAFGEEARPTLEYAQERLDQVTVRELQGHDGKFFFVQANDPLLLDPATNALVLDRPTYRSQRMLYPALAGLGGLLSPGAVLWGLMGVNMAAMALGGATLARYAGNLGLSPWLGLAFPLNPALISEFAVDGAGILAFALVVGAVLALQQQRWVVAVALFSLACLTREVMLVSVAGAALWLWLGSRRRRAVLTLVIPGVVVGLWAAYVRVQLPAVTELTEIQELGLPLAGLFGAMPYWMENPRFLVVGVVLVACLAILASQVLRGRSDLFAYVSVGFVVLAAVLTRQVWSASFDMTRAVAPVLTALVVNPVVFRSRKSVDSKTSA